MNELESYESRIREVAPEIQIEHISLNREGLMNDIVIVNGEIVFRFPKHEYISLEIIKYILTETRH